MQKNPRTRYYARQVFTYTRNNAVVLVLSALFLAGVLCATLAYGLLEPAAGEYLRAIVTDFASARLTSPLRQNFISAVFSAFIFPAVLFICGFCAVAQPVIILVPFVRGLGVGFSLAALYAAYGSSAMGFAMLYLCGILPVAAAVLRGAVESLRLSSGLFAAMRTGERASFYPPRKYFGRYSAFAVLCVLSAAMEAILYSVFANYVVLG